MRPPLARYSSVSTVKIRCALSWKCATSASISSSVVPASSRRWIASPSIATAAEADPVSTTRTQSPSSMPAAVRALSTVPESVPARWSE